MNKENLLREMKLEMMKIVENINYDNIYDSQNYLEKYFNVLNLVWDLPDLEDGSYQYKLENSDQKSFQSAGDLDSLEEVQDQVNGRYEGKAKLKLGGADLGSFRIFIPEKLVRILDIRDGDWVRATEIDSRVINGHSKPIYDYHVVRRSQEEEESSRRLVKFSTVEFDETLRDHYILSSEMEKSPTKIILNDQRLGNLSVSQGDIVDYAYWNEDILNGRVIWKHNMNFDLAKGHIDQDLEDQEELPQDFLQNNRIAFVGQAPLEESYKTCIESYGGEVSYIEALNNFHTLENQLEEVDMAIAFVDNLTPSQLKKVHDAAANIQVAMVYAKDMDCSSLMHWIRDELQVFEYEYL